MGRELGRISGPLLSANLLRLGKVESGTENLAFHNNSIDDNYLYIDVVNGSIGVRTTTTTENELNVNGTSKTTNLLVDTQLTLDNDLSIFTNKISYLNNEIVIQPDQSSNPTVTTTRIGTANLRISDKLIENITSGSNIELTPGFTGEVIFNTSTVNIDGNLHATGDITWDGDITIGSDSDDNVYFVAEIASHIIPDQHNTYDLGFDNGVTSKVWNTLYATDTIVTDIIATSGIEAGGIDLLLPIANTLFVSVNGNDSNTGTHDHSPFRTVKYALSQAVAGDEVVIYPGLYQEIFPLTVPQGVSVRGLSIRSVTIVPTAETSSNDAFLLNGETTVSHLTVGSFFYNSINDTGYGFKLAPNCLVTTRSPYVQNVSVLNKGTAVDLRESIDGGASATIIFDLILDGGEALPGYIDSISGGFANIDPTLGFASGDAGRGALVDGSVVNSNSKEATILFHAVTFIVPNADGITATNGARVEWLNSFTYFANRGIHLLEGTAGFAGLGLRFGAEMRSIGSANVYGNYGVVADGEHTLGYLIGHNFGYIGSGSDSQNDSSLVAQANEILEINQGRLYYDSMDQAGNYRIGDIFYVNQETGQVSFDAQSINFTAEGNITLEGPTSTTIIDAYKVQTGNIKIYDNNIDSLAGPVNFLAANGNTYLNTNVFVTGNLDITGAVAVDGNVFLGDNSLDTITVFPKIGQDLNPSTPDDYTLGISGVDPRIWRTMFLSTALNVDDIIEISNNTITTLSADTDLKLIAATTGIVNVTTSDIEITNNLTVEQLTTLTNLNITGLLELTGDYTWTHTGTTDRIGNTDITGSLTVNGANTVQFEDIKFVSNRITTTLTDSPLLLTANGTGLVASSVTDVDITNNLEVLGINYLQDVTVTTTLTADYFTADNIYITGNAITTNDTNVNLILSANGAGSIYIPTNDVSISNNLTVAADFTVNNLVSSQTMYSGLSWGSSFPYTWISIFSLNPAAWAWAEALLPGDVFDIVNNDGDTVTVTVDYVLLSGTVGSYADIHVVESIGMASYPAASNPSITVSRIQAGSTSLKAVEIGTLLSPATLTQIGNIDQTGDTYITGLFSNANISILESASYFEVPDIKIENITISATATDSDLTFVGATTGGVVLDSKLKIVDNIISNVWDAATTDTQKSIIFTPSGTGNVNINSNTALAIPYGNITDRPLSQVGEIRQNSTTKLYEGWSPSGLVSFNDVYDSDRNTYITAELTPFTNDNILRFVINGALKTQITSTRLFDNTLHSDNISISGNTVSNLVSTNDLTISPTGVGSTIINSIPFKDDTITNVTNNAFILSSTGTGYVKFAGTGAVVFPIGATGDRRPILDCELGETRYNTTLGYLEVFDGTVWIPAAGTQSAASQQDVIDIMDEWTLILG